MLKDTLQLESTDQIEYWNKLSDQLYAIQQRIHICKERLPAQKLIDFFNIEEKLLALSELAEVEKSMIGCDYETRNIIKCRKLSHLLNFTRNHITTDSLITEWFEAKDHRSFWSHAIKSLKCNKTMAPCADADKKPA